MKLLHISDLHIGKRVNEFSLLEDQKYILEEILKLTEAEKPDGILIAGDVYDKSLPSVEAVELLDEFLTLLLDKGQPVFMISGNHDSPERLGFGSRILKNNGLYIAGRFDGKLQKERLKDEYGEVFIYLLPFIKPAMLKPYFEGETDSYHEAVHTVISWAGIEEGKRNILLAHQFVTSGSKQPERSDSESIYVGGLDNVDASVFDSFDYVALGHLHGPQRIGRETIRYAGSPLKYSFSETRQKKSAALIELKEKGEVNIRQIPLIPKHDMREIKGPMKELLKAGKEDREGAMDYIHAILTDEEELYDAVGQLREVYPNLMCLDFDNSKSHPASSEVAAAVADVTRKNPLNLFSEFYEAQNFTPLTEEQKKVMERILKKAGGNEL